MKTISYIFLLFLLATAILFAKFIPYNIQSKKPVSKIPKTDSVIFEKNEGFNDLIGIGSYCKLLHNINWQPIFIGCGENNIGNDVNNEGFKIGDDEIIIQQEEEIHFFCAPVDLENNRKHLAALNREDSNNIYKQWIESYGINVSEIIKLIDTTIPLPSIPSNYFENANENLFNLHGACDKYEKNKDEHSVNYPDLFICNEIIEIDIINHYTFQFISSKIPFNIICKTSGLPGCQVSCLGNI